MRFIRKNGRVIPINDQGGTAYSAKAEYAKTAKLSAAQSVLGHVVAVSAARKSKFGVVGASIGAGVAGIANFVHQIRASRRESANTGNNVILNLTKHQLLQGGIIVGGAVASAKGLKATVKASINAEEALHKGANAFHKAAKPHTSAFRESRKFSKAQWVKPEHPGRKLLK